MTTTLTAQSPLAESTTTVGQQLFQITVLPKSPQYQRSVELLNETWVVSPTYWLRFNTVDQAEALALKITQEMLVDTIVETPWVTNGQEKPVLPAQFKQAAWVLQKQFLPGVTDNLASSIKQTLALILSELPAEVLDSIEVATGQTYWLQSTQKNTFTAAQLLGAAEYNLFNPLVERLFVKSQAEFETAPCASFPKVAAMPIPPVEVVNLGVSDEALMELSRSRCLALTLEEMKAIQAYYEDPMTVKYRNTHNLPPQPTDVELEVFAQTWSEHCKHKIFNATIDYHDLSVEDYPQQVTIESLFKTFISGPTKQIAANRNDLLSVFKDNAGIVKWDDDSAICFKVETHNSPSALEPYGGAMTGILGVNRDILGTGLGAKPIFNTDVFCFAHPEIPCLEHPRLLPPEAICIGVRKGVEDGGNKSGIPTVNGSLFFDQRYRAKPLVFCGTGGLMPLTIDGKLATEKHTQVGDTIVMAGGRVGKDGIHGATFSSEALHEGSPVSAVQIGDPLTQKRLLDFMIEARDLGLITGVTDNGAGGLSSSIGEMAELTNGAEINLDAVPTKYPGLAAYELLVSESQERMSISTNRWPELKALADTYNVEVSAIGTFTDSGYFTVHHQGQCVAQLQLSFLHHGLPPMQCKATWAPDKIEILFADPPVNDIESVLLSLLSHPNICSREALIRQYDHEVQGQSVLKSLTGPLAIGPADAAVIAPKLGEDKALVVSNGMCPQLSDWDAYHMATCAVDEAVRNAVAVGCDPDTITLLDNFCWPDPIVSAKNPDGEHKMAQLVRACKGIADSAISYNMPFISGKDSMKNDFDDGEGNRLSIPATLLISATGSTPDRNKVINLNVKQAGDVLYVLGQTQSQMGACYYYQHMGWQARYSPQVNFSANIKMYRQLFKAIQQGLVQSCHDISDGGLAVAVAEKLISTHLGASICMENVHFDSPELRWDEMLFSESPGRFVVSIAAEHRAAFEQLMKHCTCIELGVVTAEPYLAIAVPKVPQLIKTPVKALRQAWVKTPIDAWQWEYVSHV